MITLTDHQGCEAPLRLGAAADRVVTNREEIGSPAAAKARQEAETRDLMLASLPTHDAEDDRA